MPHGPKPLPVDKELARGRLARRLALNGLGYEFSDETVYRGAVLLTLRKFCCVFSLVRGSCLVGFIAQPQHRLLRLALGRVFDIGDRSRGARRFQLLSAQGDRLLRWHDHLGSFWW